MSGLPLMRYLPLHELRLKIDMTFEIPGYVIEDRRFALPILDARFPDALSELQGSLENYVISQAEVIRGGGGEAKHTQRLRKSLTRHGWLKKNISSTQLIVVEDAHGTRAAEPGTMYEIPSESHEIDHVKTFDSGTLALEIEWNNKDPFYDRDLENFRRLHHIGILRAGIIITRGPALQEHLRSIFVAHYSDSDVYSTLDDIQCTTKQRTDIQSRIARGSALGEAAAHVLFMNKYGAATTHWQKLIDRVDGRLLGNPCPLLLIGIEPDRVGANRPEVPDENQQSELFEKK